LKENLENLIIKVVEEMERPTIKKVADRLRLDYGVKATEVLKSIHVLSKTDALDLSELKSSLLNNLLSLKAFWFWTLTMLVASTILMVLHVNELPFVLLRYVLGSLYVLYLPGSMLTETLCPEPEDLKPLERLSLSIGSSLAIVVSIGLVLDFLPWEIGVTSVTVSLAIFTEVLGVTALIRKRA